MLHVAGTFGNASLYCEHLKLELKILTLSL